MQTLKATATARLISAFVAVSIFFHHKYNFELKSTKRCVAISSATEMPDDAQPQIIDSRNAGRISRRFGRRSTRGRSAPSQAPSAVPSYR